MQTVFRFLCNRKGQILDHHKILGKRPTCGVVPDSCCGTASLPSGHSSPVQLLLKLTSHTGYDLLPKCVILVESTGNTPANAETPQKIYSPSVSLGGQTFTRQWYFNEGTSARALSAEEPEILQPGNFPSLKTHS